MRTMRNYHQRTIAKLIGGPFQYEQAIHQMKEKTPDDITHTNYSIQTAQSLRAEIRATCVLPGIATIP